MTLIEILLIVLNLSVFLLCIYIMIYLKKIFEQVEAVCNDVSQLVKNTNPILRNLEEITQRSNRIVTGVERYWVEIDYSIKTLQEKISNFSSFKKFRFVQEQISELPKKLTAITKGISTFWREYKHSAANRNG
ncbi:MAG: hypothetical protein V1720_06590 [bacterium]